MKRILELVKKIIQLNIRTRIYFLLGVFFFFLLIILIMTLKRQSSSQEVSEYIDKVSELKTNILELRNSEKDFLFSYKDDKDFAETANNQYLQRFTSSYNEASKQIKVLSTSAISNDLDINEDWTMLEALLIDYNSYFEKLIAKIQEKGYGDYGVAANLKRSSESILKQTTDTKIRQYILEMRQSERDYFVLGDIKFFNAFIATAKQLQSYINPSAITALKDTVKTAKDSSDRFMMFSENSAFGKTLTGSIEKYVTYFNQAITLDREIGVNPNEGLKAEIAKRETKFLLTLDKINEKAIQHRNAFMSNYPIVLFVLVFIFMILCSLVGFTFVRFTTDPIQRLTKYITTLSKGVLPKKELTIEHKDELTEICEAVNSLVEGLKKSTDFANSIGKNDFNVDFQPLSENDDLGNSLLEMRNSLKVAREEEEKRKKEDQKRNWATTGISKFNDILRQSNNDIEDLSYTIISYLTPYLNANQGGLFIYNDDDKKDIHLQLVAAYAYNRRKFLEKKILIGEGLVGACVLEKKTIYLKKIPDDYISITSGLGHATPHSILIVPLLKEDQIMGVFEIASFKEFALHEIEFVEKVAETVAASLAAVKISQRTALLLDDSQKKSEAMAAQEEEMRQNLEELQATREDANRKEAEATSFVNAVNHTTIRADFDLNGNLIYANTKFLDTMGYSSSELKGKNVSMFFEPEAREEFMKRWNKLAAGGKHFDREIRCVTKTGNIWLLATYTAVRDSEGNVKQILHLAHNIEDKKLQEEEIHRQSEELKQKENQLHIKMSELISTKETLEQQNREMHETQKELAQKTYLLDALMDNIPDAVYFKDRQSKFIMTSKFHAKSFGFTNPKEVAGKSDFDFFTEEHAVPAYNDEQRIIRTGEPIINMVEKNTWQDGHVTWVSTSKLPLRDLEGNIVGTFGISRDVTNQKRIELDMREQNDQLMAVEEELRQNLEEMQVIQEDLMKKNEDFERVYKELKKQTYLLDALMDNIPDAIYFKDRQSKFVRISKAHAKQFGYGDSKKLEGMSDFDFFAEEHAQRAYNDEQRIMRTGKPMINFVEREMWEDGSLTWVTTTKMPLYDTDGNIIGTFGVSRDITEQKKLELEIKEQNDLLKTTEEELRQNLEELQAIQEDLTERNVIEQKMRVDLEKKTYLLDAMMTYIPDAIYFKDRQCRFMAVSQSMAKLFGVTEIADLIGKSDADFFTTEKAMAGFSAEQSIMRTKRPVINVVEKETWEDGRISWASTSKMPLFDIHGEVVGTFGISRDVTEIKNMETKLKEQNEALLATEEELRQNLEELQTIQEDLKARNQEEQRMRIDLEKQTYLLDALMNHVPDAVYFKDKQSRFIRISKAHARLFGVENPDELVGKSDFDFFTEDHALPAYNDEQKIIRTTVPIINVVEKETWDDGRITWASTSKMPLYNLHGEIVGTFGISRDVTDIKNLEFRLKEQNESLLATEEELRQNLEELQVIQEDLEHRNERHLKVVEKMKLETRLFHILAQNLQHRIAFKDELGVYQIVNKAYAHAFGKEADDMINCTDFDFLPTKEAQAVLSEEKALMSTGKEIIDRQVKRKLENGTEITEYLSKIPLIDKEEDAILGIFIISKDKI